jgi:predicted MFS family arabinose efflux permease
VDGEEELTRANAAISASFSVGKLFGPALGGIVVAALGPHAAALFDAGTYLLSAALLLAMHVPKTERAVTALKDARQAVGEITRELWQGVRVVLERPVLRVVIASVGVLMLSQGIINVLLVVLIKDVWHVGAQELGWIITAEGIGGIFGTLVVGAIAARVSARNLILSGAVIAGLVLVAIVNQPSVYVAMVLIALAGVSIVSFDVGLTTLLQLGSDDENRGRVSGLMQTVMAASQLVSIGGATLFADRLGAVVMFDIAGAMFMLGGLIVLLVPSVHLEPTPSAPVPQPAD